MQPDTIISETFDPQSWNRYSYVRNNPVNFSDPSGHSVCGLSGSGMCEKDEELAAFADKTVQDYGGKNDREAAARIVEKAARLFHTYDKMMPELTAIFNGLHESNPITLIRLLGVDGCAGVGREVVKDCKSNTSDESFWDQGHNRDFQDGHNQIFHYWAYLTTTASTDYPVGGYTAGYFTAQIGNFVHEIVGVGDPQGASWQDYALAEAGLNTGVMISF